MDFDSPESICARLESVNEFKMLSNYEAILHDIRCDTDSNAFQHTYLLLATTLAQEPMSIVQSNILIEDQYSLIVMVKSFINTPHIITILSFIERLCDFSARNIISCHESGIDLILLEEINKVKMIKHAMTSFINSAMRVVIKIASIISSIQVVHKFASLLSPDENKNMSECIQFFLASISDIISASESNPKGYLFLTNDSPTISITNLKERHFNKGFTVCFWIYIDKPGYVAPKIFTLKDSVNNGLDCYFQNNLFNIKMNFGSYTNTLLIDAPVPANTWTFVAISFKRDLNFYDIITAVNTQIVRCLNSELFDFKGSVQMEFGGAITTSTNKSGSYLGPFGVFEETTLSTFVDIPQKGPKAIPSNGPIFYVNFNRDIENQLVLSTMPCSKPGSIIGIGQGYSSNVIDAILSRNDYHIFANFTQIVDECNQTQLFIPMFNFLDAKYSNGEIIPSYVGIAINIFNQFLTANENVQKIFCQYNGCTLIVRHLTKHSNRHLTTSLFQKCVTLFDSVTYQPLSRQIFDEILMNFDLWILSNPETQIHVSRFWSRTLYPEFTDMFMELRSFDNLISALRIYYWYLPIESTIIHENRHPETPVVEIRQNLLQLLHSIALVQFNETNLNNLIGNIISLQDPNQVKDMLSLLRLISLSPDSLLKEIPNAWECFETLHHLMNSDNELIVYSLIEFFASLHYLKFEESIPKPHHHIDILMNMIQPSVINIKFFEMLLPMGIKYSQFLPICFYVAYRIGKEACDLIIRYLKPDSKYTIMKYSMFIPVITSLIVGDEFLDFTMKFIARSLPEDWDFIYGMIDIAGTSLNIDTCEAKYRYLFHLADVIDESPNLCGFKLLHEFFDMLTIFVFFIPTHEKSLNVLHRHFNESLFNESTEKSITSIEKAIDFELTTFPKLMQQKCTKRINYSFGLRINDEYRWLDYELALKGIRLATKTKAPSLYNIASLLAYYAFRENPKENQIIIDQLISSEIPELPFMEMLSRINNQSFKSTTQDCFEIFQTNMFTKLDNYACSRVYLTNKLIKHATKSTNQMNDIFSYGDGNLCLANAVQMVTTIRDMYSKGKKSKNMWEEVWSYLTLENAPWSTCEKKVERIKTRKNQICAYHCPLKFKNSQKEKKKTTNQATFLKIPTSEEINGFTVVNSDADLSNLGDQARLDVLAVLIKPSKQKPCRMKIFKSLIQCTFESTKMLIFTPDNVKEILFKPILHHPTGIEIITIDNITYLFNFPSHNSLHILKTLAKFPGWKNTSIQTLEVDQYFKEKGFMSQWVNGKISNFDYLMKLNNYSGRSISNISMYPILPFILKDYSKTDLSDPTAFRDLSKPVGTGKDGPSFIPTVCSYLKSFEPFKSIETEIKEFSSIQQMYNESNGCELTPEFFFMPEFFSNIDLPSWASNPYEFVYFHRKALESQQVTENLNKWIDNIWGVNQVRPDHDSRLFYEIWNDTIFNDIQQRISIEKYKREIGQMPPNLFESRHPSRINITKSSLISQPITYQLQNINPMFLTVVNSKLLTIIDINGEIYQVSININDNNLSASIKDTGSKIKGNDYSLYSDGVFVAASRTGNLVKTDINLNQSSKYDGHLISSECIAADPPFIITGSKDTSLLIYSNFELLMNVQAARGAVICCDILTSFATIAFGTSDGAVFLLSDKSGIPTCVIELGEPPKMVQITKSWGFILIVSSSCDGDCLNLYSINGELIRKKKLNFEISALATFSSSNGFDYAVAADSSGCLYMFEVFYLSLKGFYECNKKVIKVGFLPVENIVLALTYDGSIVFVPSPILV